MTTELKLRRGTTGEHSSFTGALSEITIDTTKNILVVHDGVTAGGHPTDIVAGDFAVAGRVEIGNTGLEASGININGTIYDPKWRVNDIGGTAPAQAIIHRHSTTFEPILIGARANSDTESHAAVTAAQALFTFFGAGYSGSHYDLFAAISFLSSASGTISATSSPGQIQFKVTPDASNTPAVAMTIESDGAITIVSTIDGRDLATDGTKLDTIETSADVTDTANVTSAGALMDSEVDADIKTLALPASTTISAFGATLIDDAAAVNMRATLELVIDTDVQSFDADTAKLDVDQAWTSSQRAQTLTDNDGSFDMDASQDFNWTPAAADVLEFTNETIGQRGMIRLVNPSAYAITLGSEVKAPATLAADLSVAGTYILSYWCYDGAFVAVTASVAVA